MTLATQNRIGSRTQVSRRRRTIASALRAGAGAQGGMVLIVTLWIVLAIAGLVLVFARAMRVETIAAANRTAAAQAETAAAGALQYAIANLDGRQGVPPLESETPCEAVTVGDGHFWILRPPKDDETDVSFAIVDEASKININTATQDMLLKLPGVTTEVVASIADWRDSDSNLTTEGAENDYYLRLPEPYYCKNAPFETVEELFLVKGVTAGLLFGQDINRNGALDAGEGVSAGESATPVAGGLPEAGLLGLLTTYSVEPNTDANGATRFNVNMAGSQQQYQQQIQNILRSALTGARLNTISQAAAAARAQGAFTNIFDFYYRVGLTQAEFGALADRLTTRTARTLMGMINVNTASRIVLQCLPGLDANDADALAVRRASTGVDLTNIAWVVGALAREKAVGIGDTITVRSYRYCADIVAVSGNGRAFKRCRAILDTRTNPPRVMYWKDWTRLGWPLPPDILTSLRHGADLSSAGA